MNQDEYTRGCARIDGQEETPIFRAYWWFWIPALALGLSCQNDSSAPKEARLDQLVGSREAGRTAAEESQPPRGVTRIGTNTQSTFGHLRIGVGNIWKDDYKGSDGESHHGLTALAALFVRGQPEVGRHQRVHEGKTLRVALFTVDIVRIGDDFVDVRVEEHSAASPRD